MNKFTKFNSDISNNYSKRIRAHLSPVNSYRSRCEFGYSKESYVMHKDNSILAIPFFWSA